MISGPWQSEHHAVVTRVVGESVELTQAETVHVETHHLGEPVGWSRDPDLRDTQRVRPGVVDIHHCNNTVRIVLY